jgi:hypothetical protein
MNLQSEALRQQIPQHDRDLLFAGVVGDLGGNLVLLCIHPRWTVNLIALHAVRRHQQAF